jgi:hypothetical protein
MELKLQLYTLRQTKGSNQSNPVLAEFRPSGNSRNVSAPSLVEHRGRLIRSGCP